MFPWEGQALPAIDAMMRERDPRRYRLALLTTTADGDSAVMVWFPGRSELGQYLARVEPRRRGLEGLEYAQLRDTLQARLAALEVRGTTAELRESVNEHTLPVFRIHWWGTLESLRQGGDAWSRSMLRALTPPADPPLPARRTVELLDVLAELAPGSSG